MKAVTGLPRQHLTVSGYGNGAVIQFNLHCEDVQHPVYIQSGDPSTKKFREHSPKSTPLKIKDGGHPGSEASRRPVMFNIMFVHVSS